MTSGACSAPTSPPSRRGGSRLQAHVLPARAAISLGASTCLPTAPAQSTPHAMRVPSASWAPATTRSTAPPMRPPNAQCVTQRAVSVSITRQFRARCTPTASACRAAPHARQQPTTSRPTAPPPTTSRAPRAATAPQANTYPCRARRTCSTGTANARRARQASTLPLPIPPRARSASRAHTPRRRGPPHACAVLLAPTSQVQVRAPAWRATRASTRLFRGSPRAQHARPQAFCPMPHSARVSCAVPAPTTGRTA